MIIIGIFLFKIEFQEIYKGYLTHLDLYFKMEAKILEYGLEQQGHQLSTIPILNTEFSSAFIIDKNETVLKHSHLLITPQTTLRSLLPLSFQNNYHSSLLRKPDNQRFEIDGTLVYKTSLKNTGLIFITLVDKKALTDQAILESVDTLIAIVGALTVLLIIVHFLIRREFIKPTTALIQHLEQEAKGISNPPSVQQGWQPWIDSISTVFQENRHLIKDLEGHIKNLDEKVIQRTEEIHQKNKELETAFSNLKQAQSQIILQEKMASLGSLTAGIAHEMKNPLNFVINFSEVSQELMNDLSEFFSSLLSHVPDHLQQEVREVINDLKQNMGYIREHGQRADHIVRSMLLHAHGGKSEKHLTDINQLLTENVDLGISGFKGTHRNFHIKLKTQLDPAHPKTHTIENDLGRVFLNIINNACYATWEKKLKFPSDYDPCLFISSRDLESTIEIRIRDNGPGMPEETYRKAFDPFFTTKPTGQGTGLGLSMCYEMIVTHHQGSIDIETKPGQYTEFIISLPKA